MGKKYLHTHHTVVSTEPGRVTVEQCLSVGSVGQSMLETKVESMSASNMPVLSRDLYLSPRTLRDGREARNTHRPEPHTRYIITNCTVGCQI